MKKQQTPWKKQILKEFLKHRNCPRHQLCCSLSDKQRQRIETESKANSDPDFLRLRGLFSDTDIYVAISGWFESARASDRLGKVKDRKGCEKFFFGLLEGLDPAKPSVSLSSKGLFSSFQLWLSGSQGSTTMGSRRDVGMCRLIMVESHAPEAVQSPRIPYERTVMDSGFMCCYVYPTNNDNFYKLLGLGMLCHAAYDYSMVEFFPQWKAQNEEILSYFHRLSEGLPLDALTWDGLKQATIAEASKPIRYAETRPGLNFLRSGHMPNLDDQELVSTLCESLSIVLTWYEVIENTVTTRYYCSQHAGDWAFYVCMGRHNGTLYLFIHKRFTECTPQPQFPFYTTIGPHLSLPTVIGKLMTDPGRDVEETAVDCVASLANLFVAAIDSISIAAVPWAIREQLSETSKNWERTQEAIKGSRLAGKVDTEKITRMLWRFRNEVEGYKEPIPVPEPGGCEPANPREAHTVHNCHKYPSSEPMITVKQFKMHESCLRNFIYASAAEGQEIIFYPKCAEQIPEQIISRLAPNLRRFR